MQHVLIWHPEGNTAGNPSLHALVECLLSRGVAVTVRTFAAGGAYGQRPGLTWQHQGNLWRRLKSLAVNRLASGRLGRLGARVDAWRDGRRYDLIIGVDRRGLIEAWLLAEVTGLPYVFFSFEIAFESETSAHHKRLERAAAPGARWWFVQDPLRAEALAQENRLDPSRRCLLPLAPARPRGAPPARRLRDALGIPPGHRVVITIGSVTRWAMTAELVASTANWPPGWTLVVHERSGRGAEALRALGVPDALLAGGRVVVSGAAARTLDGLDEVLAGVSLGLAFYRPEPGDPYLGLNLQKLGLASGKIATYLAHGVPVLMNEIGPYADLARTHGFGAVVAEPSAIAASLPALDLHAAARRATAFFDEQLDFERHAAGVLARLEQAAARA